MLAQKTLPIYLRVEPKPCLVVGGGPVARRKILWLLEAGAQVDVMASHFLPALNAMARHRSGQLQLHQGEYTSRDLSAYLIVIAATDQVTLNRQVAQDARRAGVPVNVVDQPRLCSFYVPATVRRGDLCLAVATGGACPALAARIRRELADRYPAWYGTFTTALARVRQWLATRSLSPEQRRCMLGALSAPAMGDQLEKMELDAMEQALREKAQRMMNQ